MALLIWLDISAPYQYLGDETWLIKVTWVGNLKYLIGNVTYLPQMLSPVGVRDFDQKNSCFCAYESATAASTIGS